MMRRKWLVAGVFLLLLAACGSTGERYVEVRPVPIRVHMVPLEIEATLLDLGYDRVDQKETTVDWSPAAASKLDTKEGSVIVTTDEYQTLYRSRDDASTFVRVRVRRDDGLAKLLLHEKGHDGLSEAGGQRLQAIRARLALQYGEDRVRVK